MLKPVPCRGCGKTVYFVKDKRGKTQILDTVAPVWRIKIGFDSAKGVPIYEAERASGDTYVTHFATCPKASFFSASKKEVPSNA